MKISCPSCSAKYSIADDKVQNRLAKIRCRKCGTSIVIDGTQAPPNVYAATDAAETAPAPPVQGSSGTLFSVDFGEGDQRQLTVTQLVDAYNSGQVNAETYLWAEGYADWTPLGQVEEVVGAIHKAASVVDSNTAAALSTAPFEDPFPQPPQRSGADLFGGISSAGSERDFATSSAAPSPAAARAFGTPAAAAGARNESSVLFSLSALTSGSTSSRPSVPAPSAPNNDDSGLIDLKALTAAAAAQARPAPHVATGAVAPAPYAQYAPPVAAALVSPLGVPGTRGASVPPAKKGNAGLYIIGASIVVAVAAAAAVITLINKEPPPPPVLTQVAPPAPAPAPAPAALPEQTDAPALPAADEPKLPADSASKTPTKKPTAKPSTSSSSATSKPSSTPASSSPPASSSSKPAAASKPSKCNCKAGDLMCAMRCSSK